MDQLLKEFKRFDSAAVIGNFTLWDVIISMGLAFLLSMLIAETYRRTHRGVSYSQSFVQTLFIMSVTVALIMLIIGSNIARAFSLVGALSIIRFRHAIKDTRDIAFLFFAMAIGMACGTRFYMLATLGASMMSFMVYVLYKTDFGAKKDQGLVIKLISMEGIDAAASAYEPVLRKFSDYISLMSVEPAGIEGKSEILYYVQLKALSKKDALAKELTEKVKGTKVVFLLGQQSVDF